MTFSKRNLRNCSKFGYNILSLTTNQYGFDITTLQGTRWQGKDVMDMKSHTLFASGKEFGMGFVGDRSIKRNVLDFKRQMMREYVF